MPQLPYSLKDLNITRLPNDDEVCFENMHTLMTDFSVDRFIELINNDNDIFYLECSFPGIYGPAIEETLQLSAISTAPAN